jgi:uncharacterized membrane protein
MISENSVEINAPARSVWDIYSDVERWPDWTKSVTSVVPLDGPGIEVGKRFEIKQPRLPKLVWEVTHVDPGVSWTWRQRSPGGTTLGCHDVLSQNDDRTLVRQSIDQRGPIGVTVGLLMLRLTKRYLALEAAGLKQHCERLQRSASSR